MTRPSGPTDRKLPLNQMAFWTVCAVQEAFDTSGVGVGDERNYCGELFGKGGGYFFVVCEGFGSGFGGEGDWLVGGCVRSLLGKFLYYFPEVGRVMFV